MSKRDPGMFSYETYSEDPRMARIYAAASRIAAGIAASACHSASEIPQVIDTALNIALALDRELEERLRGEEG